MSRKVTEDTIANEHFVKIIGQLTPLLKKEIFLTKHISLPNAKKINKEENEGIKRLHYGISIAKDDVEKELAEYKLEVAKKRLVVFATVIDAYEHTDRDMGAFITLLNDTKDYVCDEFLNKYDKFEEDTLRDMRSFSKRLPRCNLSLCSGSSTKFKAHKLFRHLKDIFKIINDYHLKEL